ncbi:hypothetical protein GGR56DRAFT_627328 [Xylariaceae sp. FL0804]|nr:hypothetical protein GGR56DRAFT_627328 [Xylariaceae sp. FL0804]
MLTTREQEISSHFCLSCGTTLFRTGGAPVNMDKVGIRAGVLDNQTLRDKPPAIQVFVDRRPPWINQVEGALQLNMRPDGKL